MKNNYISLEVWKLINESDSCNMKAHNTYIVTIYDRIIYNKFIYCRNNYTIHYT